MKAIIGILLGLLILGSCGNKKNTDYKPEGLRKLSNSEIIDNLVKNKVFNPNTITYTSNEGVTLGIDTLMILLKKGESFGDQYVNKNDSVVEMVVRPMVDKDKILLEQIDSVRMLMTQGQGNHDHDHSDDHGHDHNHDHN